jgi:photosystem II stability/assembly factor-like uncharacterized protein
MKILQQLLLLLAFLLISFAEKDLSAQWTQYSKDIFDTLRVDHDGTGALHISGSTIWGGVNTLWYSDDTGTTWHKSGLQLLSGTRIHDINFFDRMNGLVATSDDGVLLTQDGGNTWKQILLAGGSDVWKASFNGSTQIIHATGSDKGVCYTSTDGGTTWSQSYLGPFVSCMAIASDHTVYVFAQKTYKLSGLGWINTSTDFGRTWTSDTLALADGDSYTLAVDSCNPKKLYLLSENWASTNDDTSKIFITNDGGKSWQSTQHHRVPYFTGALAVTKNCLFAGVDTDGVIHLHPYGVGIVRSTDKGVTWENIDGPSIAADARTIEAMDDNTLFAIDNQGHLWSTFNCGAHYLQNFGPDAWINFYSQRIINDSSNITIHLPIYFHHSGPVSDVDMTMHYPSAVLKVLDTKLYNGKRFDVAVSEPDNRAVLHFNAADLNTAPDSLLGYVDFLRLPHEADCNYINFDSITIADHCSELRVVQFRGIIGSTPSCQGALGVTNNTVTDLAFTFSPNPAKDYGTISSKNYSGPILIKIYDNIGKLIRTIDGDVSAEDGCRFFLLDIPTGIYMLRVYAADRTNDIKIVLTR